MLLLALLNVLMPGKVLRKMPVSFAGVRVYAGLKKRNES